MDDLQKELEQKYKKFKNPDKNVSRSFQIYGVELAEKLGDSKRKALYIKLAKEEPRSRLEKAYQFAIDYPNARSKAKIFMYKLKDLREEDKKTSDS